MPMDNRDRHHHAKAKAAAEQLGLSVLAPDEIAEIKAEEWATWSRLAPTKRLVGWLAEGLVASRDAAELASIKRTTMNRLPGDRAVNHGGVGWVDLPPTVYPSLVEVESKYPAWSPEYKAAAWFFESGAISVRFRQRSEDLVSIDAAFPVRA